MPCWFIPKSPLHLGQAGTKLLTLSWVLMQSLKPAQRWTDFYLKWQSSQAGAGFETETSHPRAHTQLRRTHQYSPWHLTRVSSGMQKSPSGTGSQMPCGTVWLCAGSWIHPQAPKQNHLTQKNFPKYDALICFIQIQGRLTQVIIISSINKSLDSIRNFFFKQESHRFQLQLCQIRSVSQDLTSLLKGEACQGSFCLLYSLSL